MQALMKSCICDISSRSLLFAKVPVLGLLVFKELITIIEQWHEISNYVVCATSKGSDQPAHTHSLIRAFASRLNILWAFS